MRIRRWLAGLLVALCVAGGGSAPARAAIWPFSLFGGKTAPVKKAKPKRGKPRPAPRPAPGFSR
jgi:hypothetical protein